ncbi:MAG: hemolysin family protein [Bacteroidaceae bacterium]
MNDILIIFVLLLINAYFSMAEVALISAKKAKLTADMKAGSNGARKAIDLMNDPDKFLSTAQIGITIVSIMTGVYSGSTLADGFSVLLQGWGVSIDYSHTVAQSLIVVVATYLSCIIGELVPKRIGIDFADRIAKFIAPSMFFISKMALPFVWLLSKTTEGLMGLCSLPTKCNTVTEEEIKSMIQEGTDSGEVQEVEQDIMERALILGDQKVEALMTHRKDMIFLEETMTAEEVEQVIRDSVYAAYPVSGDDDDDVRGIVTLKDLVLKLGKPGFSLTPLLHRPLFFPENMTVYKALEQLKQNRFNRALVCDEFGGLQGIITLKDILEGLVGTIHEISEEPDIIERNDKNSWLVSGQCLFYDFLAYFEKEDLYTTDYNTLSGLILSQLERIPMEGETIDWKCFVLEVVDMDGNRIDKILVTKKEKKG